MRLSSTPTYESMFCVLEGLRRINGATNLDEMALRAVRHQLAVHLNIAISPMPLSKPCQKPEIFLHHVAAVLSDLQCDPEQETELRRAQQDIATQLDTTWAELLVTIQ